MSSFMDAIADDIDKVFFDPDIFGSIHNVNGNDILILVDENELAEVTKRYIERRDDVHKNEVLLFLQKSDIGDKRLKVNSILELDGNKLFIHDAKEEDGVYKVIAGRYQV